MKADALPCLGENGRKSVLVLFHDDAIANRHLVTSSKILYVYFVNIGRNKMSSPSKARIRMLTNSNLAFFASLAMRLEIVEDKTGIANGTAGTDGKNFYYDPKFWDTLTIEEQQFVWAHEVMHAATGHLFRKGSRDHMLWNAAGDLAINPILVECGMQMPKGGLLEDKYKNMTAEQIYNDLEKNAQKVKCSHCTWVGPNGGGKDKEKGNGQGQGIEPQDAATEQEWQGAVIQAAAVAKSIGKLPGGLESLVEMLSPKIDWRTQMRHWLGQRTRSEYRFLPPSRRWLHRGMVMPSCTGIQLELAFIVDTSGSMCDEELGKALGEINAMKSTHRVRVHLLHVDADVHEDKLIDINERCPRKITWKGRGGTNLQAGLDYLEKKGYPLSGVIGFTDGYTSPAPLKTKLGCPTLWIVTAGGVDEFVPKGGGKIKLT